MITTKMLKEIAKVMELDPKLPAALVFMIGGETVRFTDPGASPLIEELVSKLNQEIFFSKVEKEVKEMVPVAYEDFEDL